MRENDIQKTILQFLWYNNIYSWRNNSGAYKTEAGHYVRYGFKGSADILGILPDGRFLAIEVKKPKTNPTKEQKLFLKNIEVNGGVSFVARSLEDVKKHLTEYL